MPFCREFLNSQFTESGHSFSRNQSDWLRVSHLHGGSVGAASDLQVLLRGGPLLFADFESHGAREAGASETVASVRHGLHAASHFFLGPSSHRNSH